MADISKLMRRLRKPNPKFDEQTGRKAEAQKQYDFLVQFQGITTEFDDVLSQLKRGIDAWKPNEQMIAVTKEQYQAIEAALTKAINILEEDTNFQIQ